MQTDKTAPTRCREFFNELSGIQQPVPAEELAAREELRRAAASRRTFETTGDISRRLEEELVIYRLPDDYYAHYVPHIEAVTAADVQRVAQKYIQPERSPSSSSATRGRSSPASRR